MGLNNYYYTYKLSKMSFITSNSAAPTANSKSTWRKTSEAETAPDDNALLHKEKLSETGKKKN